jgi:Mor family transcriptional regulator
MYRLFTDEQELKICQRYKNGESTHKLGRVYEVYPSTICDILTRHGILRRFGWAIRKFSDIQEIEIIVRYQNGESLYELGKVYNTNEMIILHILKRHGVARRSLSEAARKFSDIQEIEIITRYQNGENTVELCEAYDASNSCIWKILKRHGVNCRSKNGENNPNWSHGLSHEPYSSDWKESLKENIRRRDNHTCQLCGKKWNAERKAFSVHHIDYNKKNCDLKNLITLCHSCHMKTNSRLYREYWMKFFSFIKDYKQESV